MHAKVIACQNDYAPEYQIIQQSAPSTTQKFPKMEFPDSWQNTHNNFFGG